MNQSDQAPEKSIENYTLLELAMLVHLMLKKASLMTSQMMKAVMFAEAKEYRDLLIEKHLQILEEMTPDEGNPPSFESCYHAIIEDDLSDLIYCENFISLLDPDFDLGSY